MGGTLNTGCSDFDPAEDIRTLLVFYRSLGFERLPVAPVNPPASSQSRIEEKTAMLARLRDDIGDCHRCKLSSHRTNIVFGTGNPDARLMFIGEAPGREEDVQGIPFVGDAGILLTRLIERMGFERKDVYIGNIIKCRPPMNRDPEEDEVTTCRTFIEQQVDIVSPQVIIALGRIAVQAMTGNPRIRITAIRGNVFDYRGIPVMPTFHPAYLLRNPKDKWLTWADALKVMEMLGLAGA